MIPGNTPEDQEWEEMLNALDDSANTLYGEACEQLSESRYHRVFFLCHGRSTSARRIGYDEVSTMDELRDLYHRRNIELAIFNELTDPVLINASIYRIKAIDEQIRVMRAALGAA